jgi:pyruvate,water dikinase
MKAFMQYFVGAAVPSVTKNLLTGKGASRGQVRGRARVVRQLKDGASLERGDILVCQTTSPPWTPLFAIAGGIVTDTGGILSHSAICAREYGIPCVVATQVATAMIPDGATVVVDGTAGTVTIEAPA